MRNHNKYLTLAIFIILFCVLLCACQKSEDKTVVKVKSDTLYVNKVDNLPKDFILGMDASCVPSLEKSGVKYYDHSGAEKDVPVLCRSGKQSGLRCHHQNHHQQSTPQPEEF